MKKRILSFLTAAVMLAGFAPVSATAIAGENAPRYQTTPRQMEKLNRGLIAVKTTSAPSNGISAGVYLSWRLLGDEDLTNQAFDIYRNGVKIYTTGAHDATNYTDTSGSETDTYKVVKKGATSQEVNAEPAVTPSTIINYARGSYVSSGTSLPNAFTYVDIPLVRPANVTNYGGGTSIYYDGEAGPNDASVGDLDGDGDYEFVLKWNPSDAKDSASSGYTGNVYIDAYEIDPENNGYMWRIDLGRNIRAGAHYEQFMVYDFDGDGKSEIAMKTAPGTIDGTGKYVTEAGNTEEIRNADNSAVYLSSSGKVTGGGEYVTIFDGETGEALYTMEGITRGATNSWGDSSNRIDRFLAGVAYIDGVTPHYIECRGYYKGAVIRAYKWDGSELSLVWEYKGESGSSSSMYGQGNHSLSIADVDNDGKDEIVYGSATLDHDGKTVIGNTRFGHGDAMHTSDFNNDGVQEVFSVQESNADNAENLRVAATGEILYSVSASSGTDNGRGAMANVDDAYALQHPEALSLGWSIAFDETHNLEGTVVGVRPKTNSRSMTNFFAYWDGDLAREILDDNQIAKYYADTGWTVRFYNDNSGYLPGSSINGSKNTPNLVADIWGDWREEIVMTTGNSESEVPCLRVMTSVIPTTYRLTTLMHDCQYRLAIAWQNVAYNQPPHTSYYIGSAALATTSNGTTLNYLAPQTAYTVPYYVSGTPVEGVSLLQNEITLKQGQTYKLTAKLEPANATKKGISWESDDESVAVVSGGNITAVSAGKCTVTAVTRDGGYVDTCTVTVVDVENIDVLGDNTFESVTESFSGGVDYASLNLVDSSTGGYFIRTFTPYYENKATLSFTFNSGGKKIDGTNWNWDGHEYSFGLEFLDTYGNNILNVAQWYTSSAGTTSAKITDGDFEGIQSTWSVTGDGEEPMNRSSTTWYVTVEFDYDADTCTASIAGSDGLKAYTKTFNINAASFKTLKYWAAVNGSGTISVGPSLSNLSYTLTCQKAESLIQIVSVSDNKITYLAHDSEESTGELVCSAFNEGGELVFCESREISLPATPSYNTVEFEKSFDGYQVGAFVWTKKNTLVPIAVPDKTVGVVCRLAPVSVVASSEPEAQNSGKNAADGNLYTFWAAQGVQNITLDFGGEKMVSQINVAFFKYADDRTIPFTVSVSSDQNTWQTVYSGNSVPLSGDFLSFYMPDGLNARYVKLEVEGNSVSGWNSVSEIEVYGN